MSTSNLPRVDIPDYLSGFRETRQSFDSAYKDWETKRKTPPLRGDPSPPPGQPLRKNARGQWEPDPSYQIFAHTDGTRSWAHIERYRGILMNMHGEPLITDQGETLMVDYSIRMLDPDPTPEQPPANSEPPSVIYLPEHVTAVME